MKLRFGHSKRILVLREELDQLGDIMWGYGHSGAVWELQGPKGADLLGFRRGSVRLLFGGNPEMAEAVGSDWRVAQVTKASSVELAGVVVYPCTGIHLGSFQGKKGFHTLTGPKPKP